MGHPLYHKFCYQVMVHLWRCLPQAELYHFYNFSETEHTESASIFVLVSHFTNSLPSAASQSNLKWPLHTCSFCASALNWITNWSCWFVTWRPCRDKAGRICPLCPINSYVPTTLSLIQPPEESVEGGINPLVTILITAKLKAKEKGLTEVTWW